MMTNTHSGICIGGPMAGQILTAEGTVHSIAECDKKRVACDPSGAVMAQAIRTHTYQYEHELLVLPGHQAIHAWVHHEISDKTAAVLEVFRFYSRNQPK